MRFVAERVQETYMIFTDFVPIIATKRKYFD